MPRSRAIFRDNKFSITYRLWLLFAIILLAFDSGNHVSHFIRPWTLGLVAIHEDLAAAPTDFVSAMPDLFSSSIKLLDKNQHLQQENSILLGRIQLMQTQLDDYYYLRSLLGVDNSILHEVGTHQVAEIISIVRDSSGQRFILNKGSKHNITVDDIVITSVGILGQVASVSLNQSEVLLILNSNQMLPVYIERGNIEMLAAGTGTQLQVLHAPVSADIVMGDSVISSGAGGRFPQGYDVGKVVRIVYAPDLSYKTVFIEPEIDFQNVHYVLVVDSAQYEQ